ncbi:LuxR C-terminal-related transcriptional regulator [uncultured Rikenella sp.]|uniref:helix-turn-helix transcriptional regulator n=1 Tax=uncultured Rikenella sp. TaxID=368003 RepID=UPI002624435B|nr:LuxR C-terminal-related transcriptional regulator [uncultured Rikenella sp.]
MDKALSHRPAHPGTHLCASELEAYKKIAAGYARIENSIAVLSDLRSRKSHIYYGAAATVLGLGKQDAYREIGSIWETEILERIHPDDRSRKYRQEWHFFQYQQRLAPHKRPDHYLTGCLRLRDAAGRYRPVIHRIFYLSHPAAECSPELALCLYNLSAEFTSQCFVTDTLNGHSFELAVPNSNSLLSDREQEILRSIDTGKTSKIIANELSISLHTVNRHRQNILHKLQAGNSIEACRVAKKLGWM